MIKNKNLNLFSEQVSRATTDTFCEKVVRYTLAGISENCPLELLIILANSVIKYREQEIINEIEKN